MMPFKAVIDKLRGGLSKIDNAASLKRDKEVQEAVHAATLAALDKLDDAMPELFKLLSGQPVSITVTIKLG